MLRLAHTVRHVADIRREAGRPELSESCYHEALNLYRNHAMTPPLDLANAIRGLAILKTDAGDAAKARALWEEARDLYAASTWTQVSQKVTADLLCCTRTLRVRQLTTDAHSACFSR